VSLFPFTLSQAPTVNGNNDTYVAWNWKAGGTAVSNTDGSITSSVSANPDAGFSIVKYTGNGTNNATVGHGLSQSPELLIGKDLDDTINWQVLSSLFSEGDFMSLNLSNAKANSANVSFDPTSTTFKLQGGQAINQNTRETIAYCFHSVPGYSKLGSYVGNGSATGPVVYLGFEPAFLLVKGTTNVSGWLIHDNKRTPSNPRNNVLLPNRNDGDIITSNVNVDFFANGFQIKTTNSDQNANGQTYIFMAIG